ncbi:unnamed protein product [Mytilus edulis]|uniref:Uncharacterized protein n=1 Tax=Mytilus edulis TaxID=6550 RepID=A0A8S3S5E4_MYTED|nr:unnamed protein product [Mytilus edulis]
MSLIGVYDDRSVISVSIDGPTAFQIAAEAKQFDIAKLLLGRTTRVYKDGDTALYKAAKEGDLKLVQLLLEKSNVDPNQTNQDGHTAFDIATEAKRFDIVKLLLGRTTIDQQEYISTGNILAFIFQDGNTVLHIAAKEGDCELVQLLLEKSIIDPNQMNQDGNNVLHKAAKEGDPELVQLLLETSNIDPNQKNEVHDFKADLSDHCQVSTMLKVNCIFNAVQKDVYSIPNQYIWEENSAEKFQNALASPLVQEKIKTFNNTNYTGDSNIMIQDLNNILYEAANISIKKKIIKKVNSTAKVKKSQQSKWFDLPLINMKKQLCDKEKLFKKYNKDPYIRSSFFALLKKYRKARKTKYREFRADLIDQLDNLREENPKSYWTLLESLKNFRQKTEKSSNITSTEWAEYFKDLNKKPVTPSPNIIEFLRNLENAKVFTELDILITDKEISDAIHTLKNKKSCGPDSISNEMIKNSQSFLIKSLNHVFNKILSTGNYPQKWANGFITALFKNGSKDDPSNYRGLTVTSCLSKDGHTAFDIATEEAKQFDIVKLLLGRTTIDPTRVYKKKQKYRSGKGLTATKKENERYPHYLILLNSVDERQWMETLSYKAAKKRGRTQIGQIVTRNIKYRPKSKE